MKRIVKYYDELFYMIVIIIAVCLPIFFSQIIAEGYSDIGPHTDFAMVMLDRNPEFVWGMPIQAYSYPIYHLILKIFLSVFMGNKVIAASVLLSLCCVFSMVITRWCLKRILEKEMSKRITLLYGIDFLSVCSIFFIGIVGVLTEGRLYLGQGAPNLWHNPTYIMLRPFAWVCFLYTGVVLKEITNDTVKKKDLILFAIMLVISCLIKPSFAIVLLPAAAVSTIHLMLSKKSFKPGFFMLGGVAGALIVLVVQFIFTQTNELVRDTSEAFAFTTGSYYGFDFLQSVGVFIALNGIIIAYFLFEGRKHLFRDVYYTLMLFMILFGALEFFFMTDGSAGNFSWGYFMAVNIGTIMSLTQSIRYRRKILSISMGLVFLYQVVMGLVYLLLYYRGGEYLI